MHEPSPLISAETLQEQLGSEDLRVLDCRFELHDPQAGRRAYESAHVPGAVYADLDLDLAGPVLPGSGRHPLPEAHDLGRAFGAMGIGANTRVVVYDDCTGAIAARAWWLLRWLGHEQVALLEGGWSRWQSLQAPVETGTVRVANEDFKGAPDPGRILPTDEIAAAVAAGAALRLIDARDAGRYRGRSEPIDAVAGHIPGATNLPYSDCVGPDGRWKSAAELQLLLRNALDGDLKSPWSVMCGSGVTACHLAISARLAGLREPRLYVGSWSEWITDPGRPVASAAE